MLTKLLASIILIMFKTAVKTYMNGGSMKCLPNKPSGVVHLPHRIRGFHCYRKLTLKFVDPKHQTSKNRSTYIL